MRWSRRKSRTWSHPWEDLEPVAWFADLTPEVRKALSRHADWVDVAPGTRLLQQGMHTRWVWVVASGLLGVRRHGECLGVVEPGAAAGEVEVLLGVPSAVDVVALEPSRVVALPSRAFHGMLDSTSLGAAVARRMAARYDSLAAAPAAAERVSI